MAIRNIAVTDTLETFRTEFNNMQQYDFGDIALLSSSGLAATSIVGAVIEINNIVTANEGFTLKDDSSTIQTIGPGNTLLVSSSSNINAVVSSPDTLTISLTDDVSIVNNLTAGGSTHTLGTIEISGNTIRSTDSTRININDTFRANVFESETGLLKLDETLGFPRIQSTRLDNFLIFDAIPTFNSSIIFEGSSADAFETTITATNATVDRTITIPDETGTIVTTGSSSVVTSTMIVNGTISTDDIADDQISEAKIADDAVGQDQLKSVVNLQILNSSGGVLKSLYGAGA
jgi:hypothetical protein